MNNLFIAENLKVMTKVLPIVKIESTSERNHPYYLIIVVKEIIIQSLY